MHATVGWNGGHRISLGYLLDLVILLLLLDGIVTCLP